MVLKDFYRGKTILLSGCTGFLGKVVLEKCLRSLGDIKKIYVMIRPKRNQSIQDRLETTIFSSEIFTRVF
jgi:fatty acyl-CoA reductase